MSWRNNPFQEPPPDMARGEITPRNTLRNTWVCEDLDDVNAAQHEGQPSALPERPRATSCDAAGFKVLRLTAPSDVEPEPAMSEVAAYCEHGMGQALAYGADWAHDGAHGDALLAGTCSFYDHALHLWDCAPSAVAE